MTTSPEPPAHGPDPVGICTEWMTVREEGDPGADPAAPEQLVLVEPPPPRRPRFVHGAQQEAGSVLPGVPV